VSGWVVPASQGIGVQLPPGVEVAGMGRRVGAWILDRILVGFLGVIPVILAIVTGAVGFNQQALDQLRDVDPEAYQPFANVTAPMFNVNMSLLIVAAAVYVLINALYFVGGWVRFGGSPCQRGLGLWALDVETGSNLTVATAIARWALLEGLAVVIGAVFLVQLMDVLARTPTNEWLGGGYYGSVFGPGSFGSIALISTLVSWGSTIWLIVLIISAGTNPARRGLHDRLVGSIVVAPARRPTPVWPAYPYPPQGTPVWPAPGTPGAPGSPGYQYPQPWPSYPTQGPPRPPQGQPYPPQPWPGYPPQPWPGYPPQPWPGYPPQPWPGYPPQGAPAQPAPPQAASPQAARPPAEPPASQDEPGANHDRGPSQ